MSDDKRKVSDKAGEIAKNIWLAGVGAYGRAVDEAQDRLEKAGVETPKLFKDLVQAGAKLEEEAREALTPATGSSVEDRINRVRENFNFQRSSKAEDLQALHAKVDLLSKKIDILANALTEQGILQVPSRKKAPKGSNKTPAKKKAGSARSTSAKRGTRATRSSSTRKETTSRR